MKYELSADETLLHNALAHLPGLLGADPGLGFTEGRLYLTNKRLFLCKHNPALLTVAPVFGLIGIGLVRGFSKPKHIKYEINLPDIKKVTERRTTCAPWCAGITVFDYIIAPKDAKRKEQAIRFSDNDGVVVLKALAEAGVLLEACDHPKSFLRTGNVLPSDHTNLQSSTDGASL